MGPLKHLSKEALEAAAEPDDLSEWADMQFLLWDAQRRAGISDAEINVAMEDKLKINMERQWPEPKDGEPRLHIKEPGNSPVIPDGLSTVCAEAYQVVGVMADALGVFGDAAVQNVLDNLSQQKLVHRDVLPFSLPATPDGWISCSERMPPQDDWILIYSKHGEYMAGQVQGEYVELSDGTLSWLGNALFWMLLPEPPQEAGQ
ncbi:TPA: dATP/dGTP pyrophosphohydrolase domain-containing protein [Escherichia coli]|uniref:dATP/dGTP pyrophosphohydrolase domain-containing protein n=1 Tax=Escherichia coli TaxID=562 RepID=UPI001FF6E664